MYRERGGEELTGVLDYYLEGKESFSSTMVRGAFLLAPKYGVENDGKGMGPLLETVNGILARSTFLFSPTLGVGSRYGASVLRTKSFSGSQGLRGFPLLVVFCVSQVRHGTWLIYPDECASV
jgi:hypothetical protein